MSSTATVPSNFDAARAVVGFAFAESLRRRVFAVVIVLTLVFLALFGIGVKIAFDAVGDEGLLGSRLVDERALVGSTVFGLAMFATLFLGAVLSVFLTVGVVRELLAEVRARGIAVLLSSHLLGEVERVCDRVAILVAGEVVERGTPAELSRPRGIEVETGSGTRLHAGATREDAPRIVAELVAAGERVYGVRVLASTLEDVYLEAVGEDQA